MGWEGVVDEEVVEVEVVEDEVVRIEVVWVVGHASFLISSLF